MVVYRPGHAAAKRPWVIQPCLPVIKQHGSSGNSIGCGGKAAETSAESHETDQDQGQVIGKIPLIIPSGVPTEADLRANANRKEKNKSKKRAKTFPEKLMQGMVDQAGNDDDAVAWLPDGKSFVVVSPDLFCNRILANVFKESKYASFVRKLHRWGFVRLTSGTGTDCFSHPVSLRV
jgi:hypothetical protein